MPDIASKHAQDAFKEYKKKMFNLRIRRLELIQKYREKMYKKKHQQIMDEIKVLQDQGANRW